jgi:ketosteroid isomerase-like protein
MRQRFAMHFRESIRVLLLWIAVGLLLAHCTRTTPEQQLRKAVAQLQAGIEAKDAGAIKHVLADDFIGPGGMDRKAAARMAQLTFLQYHDIRARIGPLQVRFFPSAQSPDHASVGFSAVLTGGSGAVLPDEAQVYQVQTGWRRDGETWLLTSATWKP